MTMYFMFKNITPFAALTSCHCPLPSPDARVLLSVWSVPYLNHTAVPAHGLGSVQCSEEPANTADGAASRYLESPSIDLQALCLSDLIPLIYLPLLLYNHKGFIVL